jgi:hypothetical protein
LKHTCPKCGHEWDAPAPQQAKAGKSRWKGVSAKKRSDAAKKAAEARWASAKSSGKGRK